MLKRKVGETSPETHNPNLKNPCTMGVGEMSVEDLEQLFDRKTANLATKGDLVDLQNNIAEQKAQIDVLQSQLTVTQDQLQKTQEALYKTQLRCCTWEREVEFLAKKACENNIIVHVPITSNADPIVRAKEICADLLETNANKNVLFKDVRRLGRATERGANVLV